MDDDEEIPEVGKKGKRNRQKEAEKRRKETELREREVGALGIVTGE